MKKTSSVVACFLFSFNTHGMIPNSIIEAGDKIVNIQKIESEIENIYKKEYQKICDELSSYKKLKNNWDGYQGIKPSSEIIETVMKFLDILIEDKIHNPQIMLSGDGEIALFWKVMNSYIEIDFDMKGYLSFFYEIGGNVYGEDDILINGYIPIVLKKALLSLTQKNISNKNEFLIINTSTSTYSNSLTV
jgi:hypothetical protein